MRFLLSVVLSVAVLVLMYEGMVTAFHLLNLPSNLAVLGGVCLLLLTAAVGFGALHRIWKRR